MRMPHEMPPEDEKEEGAPIWMITFADMTTLLMAFFVLLLSFANTDIQKFKSMMGSVKETFGKVERKGRVDAAGADERFEAMLREAEKAGGDGRTGAAVVPPVVPGPGGESAIGVDQAGLLIRAMFKGFGEEGVEVTEVQGGIVVRVPGAVMFESGSADLKNDAEPIVIMVQKLLKRYRMDLHINGHTDSVPISTAKFPSNWELSASRAAAALRYLAERGVDPKRLVAVGYADSRPIADNASFEGRQKNRRIEFLFKNPEEAGGQGGGPRPASP